MRKRMLNYTIWFNKDVAKLKLSQRLLYIGLISLADDDGKLIGEAQYVKAQIFPYDHIPFHAVFTSLQRIADLKLILWYEINGSWYIKHPNWTKHQYIRDRKKSRFPDPPFTSTVSSPESNSTQDNPIQTKCDLFEKFGLKGNILHDWCYIKRQFSTCDRNDCVLAFSRIKEDVKSKPGVKNFDAYYLKSLYNFIYRVRSEHLENKRKDEKQCEKEELLKN